jgi:hypothetical protein
MEVILVLVSIVLITGVAIGAVLLGTSSGTLITRLANRNAPRLTSPAKVLDERTQVSSNVTSYFATFELPDGARVELKVSGTVAGQIVAGDTGLLTWQGGHFVGFQRAIMR